MPHTVQINPELSVALPGYGGMGLSQGFGKTNDEESKEVLRRAIKIGATFWNTASIYGPGSHNEKLFGEVLREGDNRSKVVLTTKWGLKIVDGQLTADGSAAFARECLDNSIKNLGSAPDIWILHRIDKNVDVEIGVKAMDEARQKGECKFIGLSAMSASTLRRASVVAKIDFVEMEFSPWETAIEDNGVIDACKELGIKIIAYSPLGKGLLTGRFRKFEDLLSEGDSRGSGALPRFNKENFDNNFRIVEELERIAAAKGCTPSQLCLAWAMQVHGDLILPIPGTKSIKYLEENFAAGDITLTDEDLKAIREVTDANKPVGDHYSERFALLKGE